MKLVSEQVGTGGEIFQSISMIYDWTGRGTQYIFPRMNRFVGSINDLLFRPFSPLSGMPSAIHNLADSHLMNHCSFPHLFTIMTIRLYARNRVC